MSNTLKALVCGAVRRWSARRRPMSAAERRDVEALRTAFRSIHFDATDSLVDAEWRDNMARLRQLVLTQDPRDFLTWDVIRDTMFVPDASYLSTELAYLRQRPDWAGRWQRALEESPVGNGMRTRLHPGTTANSIHLAHHVARFEEATGCTVDRLETILEFGGGYGRMCRLLHQLGFIGRYVIFDLPPFAALQRYYLAGAALPRPVAPEWITELAALRRALTGPVPQKGLFLATWSLSETPLSLRREIEPLSDSFGTFLLAYQEHFSDVDNCAYFSEFTSRRHDVNWMHEPIGHLPGHYYLFGRAAVRPASTSRGSADSHDEILSQ